MKRSRLLLFIGLLFTLFTTPAFAQSEEGKTPAQAEYTLGEVVVSDSSSTLEKSTTVTEITAEDLKNAGALTLADAFKMVPGVTTRTAADGTCRIDIRGMRTRNVKLLLNGIPFQSVLDGQFDPDSIPVENIARIKIIRGASSVLYGNDGNAGVIDIITKKGTKGIKGTAGFMAGMGDLYKTQATLAGGTGKLDYYAGASYLTRNNFPVSSDFDKNADQDSDERKNSYRKHANVLGNLTYQATDDTSFGMVFNLFEGEYGKPPSTLRSATDPFAKNPRYEKVLDYSGADLQLAMSHKFNSTVDTRLMVYASREYNETSRYDDANYEAQVRRNSFHSKATSTTYGLNNQWGYNTNSLGRIVLGLIGERQNYSENGFTLPNNGVFADLDSNETLSNYTAALQDDLTLFDDLDISLGLSLNGQARTSKRTDTYSYVLAANYRLFEGTTLKASHARKIRNPSIQNLFDSVAGNSGLKNEINWLYEVGISQALPLASTLDFTVFRNDSEDYIEKVNDVYQNNDKYRFQGFETTLSTRIMEGLTTQLGYTYLDSQNLSDNAGTTRLQYRPRHKVTAQGTWVAPTNTTIYAGWRFFSDQYALDNNDNAKRMSDYGLIDIKVSQAFTDMLSAYVGVDNLLDEDYAESYGFARPGRVVYTGLDFTF
ncbi:TonB-dependent receptor [uncultured Pseudodesulfovibrio sp.]|uniref:TonB-dependent receptor plug domain-containing protein n=1 Tax=uncultured Pseudodesulfovibrio sp. TaxID=2035858 RepID=UPI0029C6F59F|nr:TonB-dependent receptor [uncultured Pseudodesulfovibrio sp.]